MPELIPACFRGGAAAARPPEEAAAASASAAAGPSLTTSVYETRLGLVSLSWSRTALGLSLLAELRLRDDGGNDDDDDDDEPLAFRIRPWLFWKRRGSKRFHLGDHRRGGGGGPRSVELAWDLTRARFPPGGAPEPAGGYFVAVAVDGEFALVAGDLRGEAYRRTAARSSPRGDALLISRREHVAMRRDAQSWAVRSYSTSARFGGKEREITITLTSKEKDKEKEKEKKGKFKGKFKGEDMAMSISVDGSRVLHVRRLRWKFRGSDTVDIDSSPIQISWDLHSWLFAPRRDTDAAAPLPPPPPPPPPPRAVFVFRFDREPTQSDPKSTTKYESQVSAPEKKRGSNFSSYGRGVVEEYLGKLSRRNWSESSSYGDNNNNNNNNNNERIKRRNKKKSLLKTSSSSSTASSTASTMSGSTVMDWASAEEAEMQRGEGFSLLVYALKS